SGQRVGLLLGGHHVHLVRVAHAVDDLTDVVVDAGPQSRGQGEGEGTDDDRDDRQDGAQLGAHGVAQRGAGDVERSHHSSPWAAVALRPEPPVSSTISPSCMYSWRPHFPARSSSWVTTTRVMPRSRCSPNRMSSTVAEVAESRLPVGSSAKITEGS